MMTLGEYIDQRKAGVRFACGFLCGCLTAFGELPNHVSSRIMAASCLVGGLLCGYAAMRFGDRFWAAIRRWWWLS
jgi:hypothetical protein